MAKAYKSLLNSHKCRWWLERDADSYESAIRLTVQGDDGGRVFTTPDLSTYEIGALATHFARVYFERTHKVIWPVAGSMLHTYEKAQIDAADEHYRWMQASPVTEMKKRAPEYAKEAGLEVDDILGPEESNPADAVDCPFCDGECSGDCL